MLSCALKDLTEIIIPFFKANLLQTTKRKDFELFCEIINIMNTGKHKKIEGVDKIRAITLQMNNRKKKLVKQEKIVIVETEGEKKIE